MDKCLKFDINSDIAKDVSVREIITSSGKVQRGNFMVFVKGNGNLKELKEFAQGVIDRELDIKWQGYARCDGRMDYEYLKLLKDSGCHSLSFGAESASDKVLKDINNNGTTILIATHDYDIISKFPAKTLRIEDGKFYQLQEKK